MAGWQGIKLASNLCMSSSTVSGGGITLLSSNSATTVAGRIDLDYHRSGNLTSAIANPELLRTGTAVLTSFPASIDLPRFEILSKYPYLLSHQAVSRLD